MSDSDDGGYNCCYVKVDWKDADGPLLRCRKDDGDLPGGKCDNCKIWICGLHRPYFCKCGKQLLKEEKVNEYDDSDIFDED